MVKLKSDRAADTANFAYHGFISGMLRVQNTIYLAFSSENGVCIFKAPYAESNAYKGFNNANDNSPGYKKCKTIFTSTKY